jgi:hypothetical protein
LLAIVIAEPVGSDKNLAKVDASDGAAPEKAEMDISVMGATPLSGGLPKPCAQGRL